MNQSFNFFVAVVACQLLLGCEPQHGVPERMCVVTSPSATQVPTGYVVSQEKWQAADKWAPYLVACPVIRANVINSGGPTVIVDPEVPGNKDDAGSAAASASSSGVSTAVTGESGSAAGAASSAGATTAVQGSSGGASAAASSSGVSVTVGGVTYRAD